VVAADVIELAPPAALVVLASLPPPVELEVLAPLVPPVAPPAPDEWTLPPAEPASPFAWGAGSLPIALQAKTAAMIAPQAVRRSGVFSCRPCENMKNTPIMLRYLEPHAIRQRLA
jgi:hypothetical protein